VRLYIKYDDMLAWITANYVEIIGATLGLIFLFLEIKENVWLWPVGLLSSAFYVAIFFSAKFYADMGLQVYYVLISIYGWYKWWRGSDSSEEDDLPIVRMDIRLALTLSLVTAAIFFGIAEVLKRYTDSPVPYWDAFISALSIVATWMLAKKIIEMWWIWVIANFVSLCLYFWKGLYPSVVLFFFYTVLSVTGYYSWKKKLAEQQVVYDRV
jgi:nicotinamide mononucleotide transporter